MSNTVSEMNIRKLVQKLISEEVIPARQQGQSAEEYLKVLGPATREKIKQIKGQLGVDLDKAIDLYFKRLMPSEMGKDANAAGPAGRGKAKRIPPAPPKPPKPQKRQLAASHRRLGKLIREISAAVGSDVLNFVYEGDHDSLDVLLGDEVFDASARYGVFFDDAGNGFEPDRMHVVPIEVTVSNSEGTEDTTWKADLTTYFDDTVEMQSQTSEVTTAEFKLTPSQRAEIFKLANDSTSDAGFGF